MSSLNMTSHHQTIGRDRWHDWNESAPTPDFVFLTQQKVGSPPTTQQSMGISKGDARRAWVYAMVFDITVYIHE